jgi:integrase
VLPEQATMYETNPAGVRYRFRKALEALDITTREREKKKDRARSVLGMHSLRHTFVWIAAKNGVPLPTVQSIVGHMSPAMTRMSADHADDEAKRALELNYSGKANPLERFSDAQLLAELQRRELQTPV